MDKERNQNERTNTEGFDKPFMYSRKDTKYIPKQNFKKIYENTSSPQMEELFLKIVSHLSWLYLE